MKPIRMCAVCHARKEKDELIKVVKTSDGSICVDKLGKINGRSVYICKNDDCKKKALKSNVVSRVLGKCDDSIYEEINSVK